MEGDLHQEQLEREQAYTDRLMGRWRESLRKGEVANSGDVKRTINLTVPDTAQRWRAFCKAVIEGETAHAKALLRTGSFGPIHSTNESGRLLGPLLAWFLQGNSP